MPNYKWKRHLFRLAWGHYGNRNTFTTIQRSSQLVSYTRSAWAFCEKKIDELCRRSVKIDIDVFQVHTASKRSLLLTCEQAVRPQQEDWRAEIKWPREDGFRVVGLSTLTNFLLFGPSSTVHFSSLGLVSQRVVSKNEWMKNECYQFLSIRLKNEELWKVTWSTWYEREIKKKTLSPRLMGSIPVE